MSEADLEGFLSKSNTFHIKSKAIKMLSCKHFAPLLDSLHVPYYSIKRLLFKINISVFLSTVSQSSLYLSSSRRSDARNRLLVACCSFLLDCGFSGIFSKQSKEDGDDAFVEFLDCLADAPLKMIKHKMIKHNMINNKV